MLSHELGFMSSWKMLTRDKGWIKPILILTLVGWVPIVGQIALLGYAFEWARLTAWGVDAAPKQHGVDYGKIFATGGRTFLVNLLMGLVLAMALQLLLPGSAMLFMTPLWGTALDGALAMTGVSFTAILAILVAAFGATFIHAACMRSTLYDTFSAGWRIDRLFQMVSRDFGGFMRVFLVSLIGSLITFAYTLVVSFLGVLVFAAGLMGFMVNAGPGQDMGANAMTNLLQLGAGPLLVIVVLGVALVFIGAVIATAMQLVSINAVGQWFCRFDVNRWGVSSDELPADVPHKQACWIGASPADPGSAAGAQVGDAVPHEGGSAEPAANRRAADDGSCGTGGLADEPSRASDVGSEAAAAAVPVSAPERIDGAIPLGPVDEGGSSGDEDAGLSLPPADDEER